MKKILLILVGGTICTSLNEKGTMSVDEKAAAALKINYENSDSPFAKKVEIVETDNLFILSENMTVEKWNLMLKVYRENVSKCKYDGVIFAHGTDTLAYSAAMFSMALSNTSVPVFFVSSNKRLSLEDANGNDNFRAAVECICEGIVPNVYVTYKNISDGKMYLHLGSRIRQCANYSEDFYSVGAIDITSGDPSLYKDKYPIKVIEGRKHFTEFKPDFTLKNCVLMLKPYVGMRYDVINFGSFHAVLHGTYHSGTTCVEEDKNSILQMAEKCAWSGTDVYISPAKDEGEIYDTVRILKEKHVKFIYGYTEEAAYAKLLLAYSLHPAKGFVEKFMRSELNYEKIY